MCDESSENTAPITSFSGRHQFLSNFARCTIAFEGEVYPSVEHAYQAAKTLSPAEREFVRTAPKAGIAKRRGRNVTVRSDWEAMRIDVMLLLLRAKFTDPVLCEQLLGTGDRLLIEGNTWNDTFWGAVYDAELQQWIGSNHLGRLLMQVREELRRPFFQE